MSAPQSSPDALSERELLDELANLQAQRVALESRRRELEVEELCRVDELRRRGVAMMRITRALARGRGLTLGIAQLKRMRDAVRKRVKRNGR